MARALMYALRDPQATLNGIRQHATLLCGRVNRRGAG
jgi:hypothetical protein